MASSSGSRRYDVFPSFSGEDDVRKSFLSHLLKEFDRKLINTFIDHGIERSHPIGPELLTAIRESRIAILVFSKKYASSTWCLNELVEIHKCYEELNQMVIPIFYNVDPSHVRKQMGEFGEVFDETCKGKAEDLKQRWVRALVEVANMAGEDSQNWCDEAMMIEQISKDVSNKLFTSTDDFGDFVGIEAHIDAMKSMLFLESEEARMVGILGTSGIGKTTIARALFSRLASQFHYRAFVSYKRTLQDDYSMKMSWANQLLSDILCPNNIKVESLGVVEQRLKHKKVLIVLDDVDEIELLETVVGQTGWFGNGSRIIVITQDRALLKAHDIDLIYEVEFPTEKLAVLMFCRSAFRQNSPPACFFELAFEVVKLAGNLPLGLSVLGSSLRGKDKEKWVEMMPRLRKGLNGKIEKTLRVSYDGLDDKDDQDTFLYIACLFNGEEVRSIKNLLGDSVSIGLRVLADKSLIRITPPCKTAPQGSVQMHTLLEKLGRETVRAESAYNPGKRRFLVDAKDIHDVFKDNTGTKNVLGIHLGISEIKEPLSLDKKSFKRMRNIRFIKFHKVGWELKTGEVRFHLPRGLVYLPRKLRLLHWDEYPAKCIPSSFSGEYLVELKMMESKLEKLWEGIQPLGSLKKMNIDRGRGLLEIPNLSNATNLETLSLCGCTSLVILPSSIRNLKKLTDLCMDGCTKLEVLPDDVNLKSLDYLGLSGCSRLRTFPRVSRNISRLFLDGTSMEEEDCLWIENLSKLTKLNWTYCPLRYMPSNFHPEHLIELEIRYSKLEKLWDGIQSLTNLTTMDLGRNENLKEVPDLSKALSLKVMTLVGCKSVKEIPHLSNAVKLQLMNFSGCKNSEIPDLSKATSLMILNVSKCINLKDIPDLSKATNVEKLILNNCTSLIRLPSSVQHLDKLIELDMRECTSLEVLPTNINLVSLVTLRLSGCSRLTSFPRLSNSIQELYLEDTAIEEVPFWIENIAELTSLWMTGCRKLRKISATIWNLKHLEFVDFTRCGGVTSVSDASLVKTE